MLISNLPCSLSYEFCVVERYSLVDKYDVGLFLRFNEAVYTHACETRLPPPTAEEEVFFYDVTTEMMEEETERGQFHKMPLDVANGVAVMEESVELHVADIVKQV